MIPVSSVIKSQTVMELLRQLVVDAYKEYGIQISSPALLVPAISPVARCAPQPTPATPA